MEGEREYSFTRAVGGGKIEYITKKESELDQNDLNLMLGTYVWEYDKLPPKVQQLIKEHVNRVHDTTKDPASTS